MSAVPPPMRQGPDSSHGGTAAVVEERPQEEIFRPRRVAAALKAAKNFEEFRRNRPFKFLHLYSGPNDPLGEALKFEAKRNRLEVLFSALTTRRTQV